MTSALFVIMGSLVAIVVLDSAVKVVKHLSSRPRPPQIVMAPPKAENVLKAADLRFLATMPPYLDPNDPDDVEAWRQARIEIIKHGQQL